MEFNAAEDDSQGDEEDSDEEASDADFSEASDSESEVSVVSDEDVPSSKIRQLVADDKAGRKKRKRT